MPQFNLKIVTPESQIFDDSVNQVSLPTSEGKLTILPNHVSLMAKLVPGELKIKKDSKEIIMVAGHGFFQVLDNNMAIMSDLAQKEEDIDVKLVEEARKRAEAVLEQKLSDEEYAEALASLEKSLAQLKIKRRHRS